MHMMIISWIKVYEVCLKEVEKTASYVNNWATCDLPGTKVFCECIKKSCIRKSETGSHRREKHIRFVYGNRYADEFLSGYEDFQTGIYLKLASRYTV